MRPSPSGQRSILLVGVENDSGGGGETSIANFQRDAAPGYTDFEVLRERISWERYRRGARAIEFAFSTPLPGGGGSMLKTGCFAAVPIGSGKVFVFLLLCDLNDLDQRQWDLVVAAQRI